MEENDLRNNPLFADWERSTFVDVELVIYDTLTWKGIFQNVDIANKQINHIKIPYIEEMEECFRQEYGRRRNIYTTEQEGTGEYFWYGETRNVIRTEFCMHGKNGKGYVKCYYHGNPLAFEIRYMFLRDMPYKKLGDNWVMYLRSTNGNDASKMFGDCKNVFEPCGFSGTTVEEYWKTHKIEEVQENSDPK